MHAKPSQDQLSPLLSPFTQGDEGTPIGHSDSREAQEAESYEGINVPLDHLRRLLLTHGMSPLRDE
jgi:hypothetical protein